MSEGLQEELAGYGCLCGAFVIVCYFMSLFKCYIKTLLRVYFELRDLKDQDESANFVSQRKSVQLCRVELKVKYVTSALLA